MGSAVLVFTTEFTEPHLRQERKHLWAAAVRLRQVTTITMPRQGLHITIGSSLRQIAVALEPVTIVRTTPAGANYRRQRACRSLKAHARTKYA